VRFPQWSNIDALRYSPENFNQVIRSCGLLGRHSRPQLPPEPYSNPLCGIL